MQNVYGVSKMLKVALTTLIVIHVVWWPIGFVLFQFHGDNGQWILMTVGLVIGFLGTYYLLENIADQATTSDWSYYEVIWQAGVVCGPGISAYTFAWVFEFLFTKALFHPVDMPRTWTGRDDPYAKLFDELASGD